MANVLFVIAPKEFRDEELFFPLEEVKKCGHVTTIASSKLGICTGTRGGSARAEILLRDASPNSYDAVVFVGGGGSRVFFLDPDALKLAREIYGRGKIVAAICIAPVILANSGLLNDRYATVFPSEIETIESKGARYAGPGVSVDGRIVTADGPQSAKAFGQKLCDLLK